MRGGADARAKDPLPRKGRVSPRRKTPRKAGESGFTATSPASFILISIRILRPRRESFGTRFPRPMKPRTLSSSKPWPRSLRVEVLRVTRRSGAFRGFAQFFKSSRRSSRRRKRPCAKPKGSLLGSSAKRSGIQPSSRSFRGESSASSSTLSRISNSQPRVIARKSRVGRHHPLPGSPSADPSPVLALRGAHPEAEG